MPRPSLLRSKDFPYHVTSRTLDKNFYPLPLCRVWEIMIKELTHLFHHKNLKIHAFILMGNHFHLICQTPNENLDEVMHLFLRNTSLLIQSEAKKNGSLWAPRYKWSLISTPTHYYQVYRYLFQNSLRAGLVEKVENYPYSSLKDVPFPLCTHVPLSFGGQTGENLWLNELYGPEEQKLIRLGLRKFQFDVSQRQVKSFMRLTVPKITEE